MCLYLLFFWTVLGNDVRSDCIRRGPQKHKSLMTSAVLFLASVPFYDLSAREASNTKDASFPPD